MAEKVLPHPQLLTTKQLAAYLNKPVETIRTWRTRKVGPPGFRLGRDIVYRKTAVDAWLDELEAADSRAQERQSA